MIQWGEPVAVLYGKSTEDRISYPDFIWDDGLYITETQKSTARVHPVPDDLLAALWQSPLIFTEGSRVIQSHATAGFSRSPEARRWCAD